MDLVKIGKFLKELRKESGLTQEQFSERWSVSNRTVSRWENGNNLPDLDVLIQLSDYYDVDLRELLEGERKNGTMNQEVKETVMKAAEYSAADNERHTKFMGKILGLGLILYAGSQMLRYSGLYENRIAAIVTEFAAGAGCGLVLFGFLLNTRYGKKLEAFKKRLLSRE